MDRPCYGIRVPNVSDQFNVDMIQGLILTRDTFSQDVVYEPSQVDIFLLLLLFLRPWSILRSFW